MHPVLLTLHIGGSEVVLRAYSTFYVLAWVVAIALGTVVAWRRGFSWWQVLVTFAAALAVGVVGARLLDIAVNWGYYSEDLSRAYGLGFRGFSIDGGLVLALAVALLLAHAFRLPLWRLADSAVPALAAGIALMRVGCFLNGCCFGTATSLPWGVTYPPGSPAWAQQLVVGKIGIMGFPGVVLPVHPTQLYEMIAALVLGGVAVWLMRRRHAGGEHLAPSGTAFLAFALGFVLFRLGNNYLRAQPPTVTSPVWSYPLYFLIVCAGVAGILAWRLHQYASKEKTVP
jgi:phosphatidylglycerol:prolipoprotein diacylglycerol transferase